MDSVAEPPPHVLQMIELPRRGLTDGTHQRHVLEQLLMGFGAIQRQYLRIGRIRVGHPEPGRVRPARVVQQSQGRLSGAGGGPSRI